MEERGFYEAALRQAGLHGDASDEFDAREMILDEATAEAVDALREDVRQLQLAIQTGNRAIERMAAKMRKLEERIAELEARE